MSSFHPGKDLAPEALLELRLAAFALFQYAQLPHQLQVVLLAQLLQQRLLQFQQPSCLLRQASPGSALPLPILEPVTTQLRLRQD